MMASSWEMQKGKGGEPETCWKNMEDNVKVAVRVRPFNDREREHESSCVVEMVKEIQQTILKDPETGESFQRRERT